MEARQTPPDTGPPALPTGEGRPVSHDTRGLLADSRKVAAWTLVSRITGFGRVAAMAAVLGPTYFGNIFQTTALLPSMLFALLGGSLVGAILVPLLVRWIDAGDDVSLRRLANGFLGVLLSLLLVVAALILLLWSPVLALVTAAVDDAQIRQQQQEAGRLLLALMMPQLLLYGIVAAGMAVQHARGRFALAAAAPVAENVASMAVLATFAFAFGTGTDLGAISSAQIAFLGAGTTLAVGVHAAIQWWGAFRAGVPLAPMRGWRDPEVRRLIRIAFTSSGNTALYNVTHLTALIVAGSIPGGVVALQIGLNFAFLPVALGAVPLASAQLPRLARSHNAADPASFRAILRESFAFSRFLTLPAGLLLIATAGSLAEVVAFGEMATAAGIAMVAASIGSLGAGVFGEASTALLTTAAYARRDGVAPLRAMALRAAIALAGAAVAFVAMDGVAVLWTLGLGLSLANLVSAAYLYRATMPAVPAGLRPGEGRFPGDLAAAALSATAGGAVAFWLDGGAGHAGAFAVATASGLAAAFLYLAVQWLRGSREFGFFLSVILGSSPADVLAGRPTSRMGRLRAMWSK